MTEIATTTVNVQGGEQTTLTADLTKEYVASGYSSSLMALVRSLPEYTDDVTRDFGGDVYRRMMLDPEVASSINTLRASVLDGGVHCDPVDLTGTAADNDTNRQLAEEIARYAESVITSMDTMIEDVLWDLLDGLYQGNAVAEITWQLVQSPLWQGARMEPRSIHVKDSRDIAFVVDRANNLVGILPRTVIPGATGTTDRVPVGSLTGTGWEKLVLPLEKFVVFTFRPHGGDPRGRSMLRSAFHAWWVKQNVYPEWLKWLAQFATGMMIGTTPPDSVPIYQTDAAGNHILGADGQPVIITPEQVMLSTLIEMRGGAAAVFRAGSQVDVHSSTGDGQAFISAFAQLDAWISKAILHQTLATGEGEHQARAAAEVHKDILDMLIAQVSLSVARVIRRDIVWPLVKYNWGEDVANAMCPQVRLGIIEDSRLTATEVASLQTSGYLDPSHYQETDAKLGLTPRSEESIAAMTAAKEAGRALAVSAAQSVDQPNQTPTGEPDGTVPTVGETTGTTGGTGDNKPPAFSWRGWFRS